MAHSLNTKVDYHGKAVFHLGFAQYGNIMIGDKAFEFFDERSVERNSQFPWASILRVEGTVSHGKNPHVGKYFSIVLHNGRRVRFSSAETGKILKILREYLGNDKVVKAPNFLTAFKSLRLHTITNIFRKNKK